MHLDYDATIATSHLRRGTSEEAEVLMAEAYPESGCPRNLPAPDAIAPATHPASPARAHTHRWGAFFCPVQCFPPELRRDGKIVFGPRLYDRDASCLLTRRPHALPFLTTHRTAVGPTTDSRHSPAALA